METFWSSIDRLVKENPVIIDRDKGSEHPVYPDMIYPLDYGYLAGTIAPDGGGIDVWVGTDSEKGVKGVICTVDLLKRDIEIKILLGCTEDEIQTVLAFIQRNNMGCQLVRRDM